ncbi:pPIWI_RE module domain-containing protein [Streptomyces sp. NPDC093984]|uniref:pPIWI_RE module domain-containing protein n=1 Tax=Streptomyces sp. NPDC093984 TaxID=3366052 RepID=UPI0037F72343
MSNVIEYVPRRRGGGDGKPAYYAATLRITVRTVPFSPVPRVHVAAGVRRFVTGKVYMPYGKGVSAYLLPEDSLVHDGPQPQRFAVAMLEWKNGTTLSSTGRTLSVMPSDGATPSTRSASAARTQAW